jgi:hypothetical protein
MSSSATSSLTGQEFDEHAARARIKASKAFEASATQWSRGVEALGLPADPPAAERLWAGLEARLEAVEPAGGTLTVRADEGQWETLFEGVTRRRLYVDPMQGWEAVMVRMTPGSRYPGHGHAGVEECLVLEGEFEFEGLTVRQGDFHLAFPEAGHPEIFSRTGALLYIRTPLAA